MVCFKIRIAWLITDQLPDFTLDLQNYKSAVNEIEYSRGGSDRVPGSHGTSQLHRGFLKPLDSLWNPLEQPEGYKKKSGRLARRGESRNL